MPYLGKEPVRGQNRELDDISGSFNGGNTAFTMQVGGINTAAGSANQVFINLGGVMQNPGTDFTIASSTITFTTPPANGLSFWGLIQGDAVDINEPADGSVTNVKVASGAAIAGSKLAAATTSVAGSMSAADKTKLDGVATSATANPSAPALTGSTNNTITTVTGANAIQGEANLTWDGSVLRAKNTTNAGDGVVYVEGGEGANAVIEMVADEGDDDADKWLMKSTNGGGWHLQNKASGSWENNIVCATNNSVNLYYDNVSKFETISTGVYCKGALRIGADNAANEMEDYEEGTWTPDFYYHSSVSNVTGQYTKIGRMVYAYFAGNYYSNSSSGQYISNLPFTAINISGGVGGVARGYQNYDIQNGPIYFIEGNTTKLWFYKDNGVGFPASDGDGNSFRGMAVYTAA